MTIWDFIALITGIFGVILTIRESIWCWPTALISVAISGITFYNERLFGDVGLQFFYLVSGIYGWMYWHKKNKLNFKIKTIPKTFFIPLAIVTIIQSIIYYYVLRYFKSDKIIFDSVLTACSFTCTFMMAKKWIENWIFWIIIDLGYAILYLIKDLPSYALLYIFFSIMATYGYYSWKKQLIHS